MGHHMRRGHAGAVILLGGWLLLTPPIKPRDGEPDVDDKMPVKKWDQLSAYDTARECQDAIDSLFAKAKEKDDKLHVNMYATARCIPAEHIYPPKEPAPK
jgi:hypothetical protein